MAARTRSRASTAAATPPAECSLSLCDTFSAGYESLPCSWKPLAAVLTDDQQNCQEYLRSLSESVTPEALLQLPVSTVVVVVGCGNPNLIDMYVKATKCPFPVYTDPNASLYSELGMVKTLAMGPKPEYMRRPMIMSVVESIGQGLRSVPSGLALKSGDHRQVGGEFLFEPVDVVTPVVTPLDETPDPMGPRYGGRGDDDSGPIEPKRVTWCHRMKSTRDHAEIPEVMGVLGLKSQAPASSLREKDKMRWAKAEQVRKGSGGSLALQMNELSEATSRRAS